MNAAQALLHQIRNDPYTWAHLTHDLRLAIKEELEKADAPIPHQRPTDHDIARIRQSMDRQAERKRLRTLLPDALQDGP